MDNKKELIGTIKSIEVIHGAISTSSSLVGNIQLPKIIDKPTILPIASSDTLGGVKVVAKTEDMTSEVGIDEDGKLWVKSIEPIPEMKIRELFIPKEEVMV